MLIAEFKLMSDFKRRILLKKYYEFMNDISSEKLYEGLLGYGLFSDKLPPFLTSKHFFDYCQEKEPKFMDGKIECTYIYYENMRNINTPRPLAIPNPISYQRLCMFLSEHWEEILEHFKNKTENEGHKISRIHLRKMKNKKHLFEMNYSDFKNDGTPEPDILIGKKYMVNADISNCFPSIYTHSISWALVGKDTAKGNKKVQSEWYNELDFHIRNNKNGETHGLLIGPHTSNLLSEIILTSIDHELQLKKWEYIRNIDDYTCYVNSYEEGQKFLVELTEQLRAYNLVLNHKKTKITSLPSASVEQWVRRLNTYAKFDKRIKINFKDVQAYLDLAIQLMNEDNNSAILNYAIKVMSKKNLTDNAVNYLVKTVLHLSIIYPYLIPMLEENIFKRFKVETQVIRDYSILIYKEGMVNNNFEEVSYAIYYSLKYNFVIDGINFDDVRNSNHCILFLLAFLYADYYKITEETKKFKKLAGELSKDIDEFNQNWLFIYETLPKSRLQRDWKKMKENNVTFIDKF